MVPVDEPETRLVEGQDLQRFPTFAMTLFYLLDLASEVF